MINPKRTVQEYILGSMQVLQFTANPYEKTNLLLGLAICRPRGLMQWLLSLRNQILGAGLAKKYTSMFFSQPIWKHKMINWGILKCGTLAWIIKLLNGNWLLFCFSSGTTTCFFTQSPIPFQVWHLRSKINHCLRQNVKFHQSQEYRLRTHLNLYLMFSESS